MVWHGTFHNEGNAKLWTYLSVRPNADEELFVFFMEDSLKLDSILYFKLE